MPNVKPLPVDTPPDRHPAMVAADGIKAHVPGVSAAITAVLQALQTSGSLPPRLIELLRIRIAFHNQCRLCMSGRYRPDLVSEDLVCSLERPADGPGLTDAERAALKFGDLFATDHLAIGTAQSDNHLALYCRAYADRELKDHGMGIAKGHVELLTLHFRTITDAVDIQHSRETLTNPEGHVGDELAGKAMQRADLAVFRLPLHVQHITLDFDTDTRGNLGLQLPFGALQTQGVRVDGNFNACRNSYR